MTQDLIVPTNTTEAVKDPIWRKSMDDEYEALIEKKVWEVVLPPQTQILSEVAGPIFASAMKIGQRGQNQES